MALKDTFKTMKNLLAHITVDLGKAEAGNKAASQRVRTGTVKLEKLAKLYRKESIKHEKVTKGKRPAKKAKKHPVKKAKAKKGKGKRPSFAIKRKPTAKLRYRR